MIHPLLVLTLMTAPGGASEPEGQSGVFLPGTQPREGGIEFAQVQQCIMCHAQTKNGDADPYFSWAGGMMAQSGRDPVYRAALAISNQDVPGVGEFCLRCHTPRGWLEGRSAAADGADLTPEDLHGITCDVCHRLVDPLSDEAAELVEHVPPGYGNGMMVADLHTTARGPYGDGTGAMPHRVQKSAFHASSNLCGICHNVSNPLQASDPATQPPHAYGHVERTYSEWALSEFATLGAEGTCQSCHYEPVPGGGQASRFSSPQRDHFVRHGAVGGSTWVQEATAYLWKGKDVNRAALAAGQERARALLRTAATLDVRIQGPTSAVVRITNNTGHKLPTGYPEGRRMWLQAAFLDEAGAVIDEIGRYGEREDTLQDKTVTAWTLLDPERTRVYECLPALSEAQARRYGLSAGKSFHFVLNDVIAKDNRIPPRGFRNAAFAEHLCAPVGAEYDDGQHWDEVPIDIPPDTRSIRVRLMYQSVSWEYIKFLVEENRTDTWGTRLHEAWENTGRCPPEIMAEQTVAVTRAD